MYSFLFAIKSQSLIFSAVISKINLRIRFGTVSAAGTYARLVNFAGLAALEELRLRFGTEKLQTVERDQV